MKKIITLSAVLATSLTVAACNDLGEFDDTYIMPVSRHHHHHSQPLPPVTVSPNSPAYGQPLPPVTVTPNQNPGPQAGNRVAPLPPVRVTPRQPDQYGEPLPPVTVTPNQPAYGDQPMRTSRNNYGPSTLHRQGNSSLPRVTVSP